jgi:hypothetical protein
MSKRITITVEAPARGGKTTVARFIASMLEGIGFANVEVIDADLNPDVDHASTTALNAISQTPIEIVTRMSPRTSG